MMNRHVISALLLMAAVHAGQAQEVTATYHEPNFANLLFNPEDCTIPADQSDQLRSLLLAGAQAPETGAELKARLLVLMLSLYPEDFAAIQTNFNLKHGLPLSPAAGAPGTPGEIGRKLMDLATPLSEADGEANELASQYLIEVGSSLTGRPADGINGPVWSPGWYKPMPWLATAGSRPMPIPSIRPSGTGPAMLSTERESSVGGIFLIETGSVSTFRISPGGQLPSNVKEQLTTVVARVYTSDVARPNTVVFELLREAPALNSAANEVIKFFSLRNQTIPQDQIVGIKFADKYSAGDGPSAALSCALLLDSLFTGAALDPKFAAIGDFNADGTVQPSFRIEERIIAAGGADCSHLAIPHQHLKALPDLLITQGTAPFLKAQVFTVEKFDDARALALAPEIRDPKIQESLKVFGEVQSALNRSGAGAHLAHADVVSRLQRVLELTPNHASALLLMMKATNREPAALTLSGSLKAVLRASENPDKGEGYFALLRDRKKLDRRVWAWADAVSHSLSLQRMGRPGRTEAYQQVQLEFQKLLNDPHIREALNQ